MKYSLATSTSRAMKNGLWLQEAIETYETPTEIAQKGFAARLGKVFVDDTEMGAAADLTKEIKTFLRQS